MAGFEIPVKEGLLSARVHFNKGATTIVGSAAIGMGVIALLLRTTLGSDKANLNEEDRYY